MAPRSRWHVALLTVTLLLPCLTARAQDPGQAYAAGVQAYFNGAASRAEGLLDQAAKVTPNDPLVYYFRGLTKLRQGRRHEGEEDFRIGASLEARRARGSLGIGHTLQRVQGSDRLLLERIRRETRQAFEESAAQDKKARYQPSSAPAQQAMRTDFRLPLAALANDPSPDALAGLVAEQATSAGDPFADEPALTGNVPPSASDPALTAESPAPQAASTTPIDVPEAARGAVSAKELGGIFAGMVRSLLPQAPTPPGPFGAGPPAGADPFGAPADGGDPFGGPPTGTDPFGAPPAGGDPFGDAPAESDPFGGSDGAPADQPAPEPSEPAADPFGGGEEDPFGGDGDPFGGEDPFS